MAAFKATLRNRGGRVVEVASDQTILEAAEAAGLVLPYGCRYGGCITCAARLVEGKVRQPGATAINARQSRAGYVLLCVARPRGTWCSTWGWTATGICTATHSPGLDCSGSSSQREFIAGGVRRRRGSSQEGLIAAGVHRTKGAQRRCNQASCDGRTPLLVIRLRTMLKARASG